MSGQPACRSKRFRCGQEVLDVGLARAIDLLDGGQIAGDLVLSAPLGVGYGRKLDPCEPGRSLKPIFVGDVHLPRDAIETSLCVGGDKRGEIQPIRFEAVDLLIDAAHQLLHRRSEAALALRCQPTTEVRPLCAARDRRVRDEVL
jgi:hypothetical protein